MWHGCLDSEQDRVRQEDDVPLSEEELRLLEQMERALVAEDPKLASTLRGTKVRQHQRRAIIWAVRHHVSARG